MGSASICLINNTDAPADIALYHYNTSYGSSGMTQENVAPGASAGPILVQWNWDTGPDFWFVSIAVSGGSRPGMYTSYNANDVLLPYWRECTLWGEDGEDNDGQSLSFTVDWDFFSINLRQTDESKTAGMLRIGDYSPVHHVFVLMLENHSFDNIFAFSKIPGITAATTQDSNTHGVETYFVSDTSTPTGMPTDPGHEFDDVLEQLGGPGAAYRKHDYPIVKMNGFAASYATSTSESTGRPAPDQIGDVMKCFDTPAQLPNIAQLANRYRVCDHWFSSLPGPTWPNRFFAHGASSAYRDGGSDANPIFTSLDSSPHGTQIAAWETFSGFTYRHGSIFDALDANGIPWRIYHDDSLDLAGSIPQVTALKNISLADPLAVKSVSSLASDLSSGYPYRYTFIEPNYGDIVFDTYRGGSSQHPMDDVAGGENLVAQVFNAIAASPLWHRSMLIITYDEHGGFYDSVPPGGAVPPDPDDVPGTYDFTFDQLGVRVPAVIVSEHVAPGVDHTPYDHSSIPATLEKLFGLKTAGQPTRLSDRDAAANTLVPLIRPAAGGSPPPPVLNAGRARLPAAPRPEDRAAATADVPAKSDLQGFLYIARKTRGELGIMEKDTWKPNNGSINRADARDSLHDAMTHARTSRQDHEEKLRKRMSVARRKPSTTVRVQTQLDQGS